MANPDMSAMNQNMLKKLKLEEGKVFSQFYQLLLHSNICDPFLCSYKFFDFFYLNNLAIICSASASEAASSVGLICCFSIEGIGELD